jgi:GDP-L-fucose synthase
MILVTGGTGLLGSALKEEIKEEAVFVSSKDYNLISLRETMQLFNDVNPKQVIHLAGKVGGVKANTDYVADFFTENIYINTNVLHCAHLFSTEKVLSVMSTCIFPDEVEYPITENQLHNGFPHPSNFGYAHAKRMLDVQSRAYRQQYGCNFITAIPNNLFGENDMYDPLNSHVIPSIMLKLHEAKENGTDAVMWGTGKPMRQFTYSRDMANSLLFLLNNYDGEEPINVGSEKEHTIKDIVDTISSIIEFRGEILWDDSMPEGQYRKPCSMEQLKQLGWSCDSDIHESLKRTYDWFKNNYPNLRGLK